MLFATVLSAYTFITQAYSLLAETNLYIATNAMCCVQLRHIGQYDVLVPIRFSPAAKPHIWAGRGFGV